MSAENTEVSANATNTDANGEEGQSAQDVQPVSPDEANSDQNTTDNTEGATEGQSPQISSEDFTKLDTSYKELQRKFTEVTQDRSSMRKDFQSLKDAMGTLQTSFSKASEKPPLSPEDFIREIQTKGVDAIAPHYKSEINLLKESYSKDLTSRDDRIINLEAQVECFLRRSDTDRYPDFAKLETEIKQLAQDETVPVDFSKPTGEVIDALYNLVRSKHSGEALLEAEKNGLKKAEERIAKESSTTVASGGKGVSQPVTDLNKVTDINKLREIVGGMHGIAERD
ncbi:MAG: hypothetical protein KAS32_26040 [Candidatus Peribacteraceae bacterium]|nr:hypothetical protein [Candidatus Peribacteraceae bacterium]